MQNNIVWIAKTEAQKKRLEDHKATVQYSEDGTFRFDSKNIITPSGKEKINKLISVVPKDNETIVSSSSVKYLFHELRQMNLLLTNACNLSCSYCYEQHNKDFGRFTNESLLSAYRFLVNINDNQKKVFQFFGGEPFIHKDIILDFLKRNNDELSRNSRGEDKTTIGIVTNGLLLTQALVDEYFSYDYTNMLISLDTDRAEVDHREIGQENLDKLMQQIQDLPSEPKEQKRITIRCTLARNNAPYFTDFVSKLYDRGIRRMVVHPLTLDSSQGFIRWDDWEWEKLHKDILAVLNTYTDLQIHFSEGVGQKEEENCMIGSDMIAIDASGDFSGCYFFTNQKGGPTADTILGNIYQDKIYLDRYKTFQKQYAKMFEVEEQCKTCDYKKACYQCPAGNMDTSGRLFKPDDMCQKIVKLYIDLQEDITMKQFRQKYEIVCNSASIEGENTSYAKGLAYLIFYYYFNYHPDLSKVHSDIDLITNYKQLIFLWKRLIDKENISFSADNFIYDVVNQLTDDEMSLDDMYYYLLEHRNIPLPDKIKAETLHQRSFYLCLLHMFVLQELYKPPSTIFSDNLIYENDKIQ